MGAGQQVLLMKDMAASGGAMYPGFSGPGAGLPGNGPYGYLPGGGGSPARVLRLSDNVGSYTLYYTDDSGVTWNSTGKSFTDNVFGVWVGNQYVVGEYTNVTNNIWTSPDGITWTQRNTTNAMNRVGMATNGSIIVCAGLHSDDRISSSPDGITWTNRVSVARTGKLARTIFWTGAKFICTASDNDTENIQSTDGITWTNLSIPLLSDFTYPQMPFAIPSGNKGLFGIFSTTRYHATADWNTFTETNRGGVATAFRSNAAYGAGILVYPTSDGLYTSTDGVTWTQTYGAGTQFRCVVFNGFKFVATPVSGSNTWSSSDGLTWAATTAFPVGSFGLMLCGA